MIQGAVKNALGRCILLLKALLSRWNVALWNNDCGILWFKTKRRERRGYSSSSEPSFPLRSSWLLPSQPLTCRGQQKGQKTTKTNFQSLQTRNTPWRVAHTVIFPSIFKACVPLLAWHLAENKRQTTRIVRMPWWWSRSKLT